MKRHTKVLMEYFGYKAGEFIPCEVCGRESGPPHHIEARGMGGSKLKDTVDNLIFLCPPCHRSAESHAISKEFLLNIIANRGKK